MQSTTDKKKLKQIFETKKGFITSLKLMINELARFPTRLENVCLANNEQALIAVFTVVFCFTHAEHHLIKHKLYNNWSAQAVNSVLCEIQRNQSNFNAGSAGDSNNKSMYSCFYKSKKFLSCLMYWEGKKRR